MDKDLPAAVATNLNVTGVAVDTAAQYLSTQQVTPYTLVDLPVSGKVMAVISLLDSNHLAATFPEGSFSLIPPKKALGSALATLRRLPADERSVKILTDLRFQPSTQ